jgi:hypothetical protein
VAEPTATAEPTAEATDDHGRDRAGDDDESGPNPTAEPTDDNLGSNDDNSGPGGSDNSGPGSDDSGRDGSGHD